MSSSVQKSGLMPRIFAMSHHLGDELLEGCAGEDALDLLEDVFFSAFCVAGDGSDERDAFRGCCDVGRLAHSPSSAGVRPRVHGVSSTAWAALVLCLDSTVVVRESEAIHRFFHRRG